MRESDYTIIGSNKSSILITSTVYDRRALDSTCDRPLVNSLNHLTYLTSTSSKVRETLCSDGGLERLIAILKECTKPEKFKLHVRAKSVNEEKEDALIAWKWTLAFQCLVLIGTRGSEEVRKRLVDAGLIPILSTVLDNYLLIHRNLDSLRDCTLDQSLLKSLFELVKENEFINAKDETRRKVQLQDTDVKSLLQLRPELMGWLRLDDKEYPGNKTWRFCTTIGEIEESPECQQEERDEHEEEEEDKSFPQQDVDMQDGDAVGPAFGRPSPDNIRPRSSAQQDTVHSRTRSKTKLMKEDPFLITIESVQNNLHDINANVPCPRLFFNGTLVPKDDDVIWSLQLLAFISKYAVLKSHLQDTSIVNGLSLRYILKCSKQVYEEVSNNPGTAFISDRFQESSSVLSSDSMTPVLPFFQPHLQRQSQSQPETSTISSRYDTSSLIFHEHQISTPTSSFTPLSSSSSSNAYNPSGIWRNQFTSFASPLSQPTPSSLIEDDLQELSQFNSPQIEPLTQSQSISSHANSSEEMLGFSSLGGGDSADVDEEPAKGAHGTASFNLQHNSTTATSTVTTASTRVTDSMVDKDCGLNMNVNDNVMDSEETISSFAVEDQESSPESGSVIIDHDSFCPLSQGADVSRSYEASMSDEEFDERLNLAIVELLQQSKNGKRPSNVGETSGGIGRKRSSMDVSLFPVNIRNALRNFEKCWTLPSFNCCDIGKPFVNLVNKLNSFYCSKEVSDSNTAICEHKDRFREYLARWNYKAYFNNQSSSSSNSCTVTDFAGSALETLRLNLFPLVEKYTNKSESATDMCYWSGVIMRNSCRKDESRGGVRQCAYSKCGKWEDFPRQFAKCRRCKRTKYCSKECQLQAWTYHKYWCVDSTATASTTSTATTSAIATSTVDPQTVNEQNGAAAEVLGRVARAPQQDPAQPTQGLAQTQEVPQAQFLVREQEEQEQIAPDDQIMVGEEAPGATDTTAAAIELLLHRAFQIDDTPMDPVIPPDQIPRVESTSLDQVPVQVQQNQNENENQQQNQNQN
ncbi:hypothetical protein WICPIJ_008408 [Wickerhamomyces pijperi]|uniref:MYND-type domain-containing protein n=1 Tax=Wickerhamomyces pijperi TaxID=599730 RepID=A0A9P8TIH9_WICPI|nr:hypothetical protein WICPIJ_008408 [Wickerhamomyces pijperi]